MRLIKFIARGLLEVVLYLTFIVVIYLAGSGLLLLGLRFWGASI